MGLVPRLRHVAGESSGDPPENVPTLEHHDVELKFPHGKKEAVKGVDEAKAVRLYFDGRSADKQGSGGYVVFSPSGELLGGAACNYGSEAGTVNAAEMESLLRGIRWLERNRELLQAPYVVIYGDSDLTVKFLNRQATPRVQKLARRVSLCQDARKGLGIPTHVLYVPRERNQLADWLSKVGSTIEDEITLAQL